MHYSLFFSSPGHSLSAMAETWAHMARVQNERTSWARKISSALEFQTPPFTETGGGVQNGTTLMKLNHFLPNKGPPTRPL